jgi:hypothetical protein
VHPGSPEEVEKEATGHSGFGGTDPHHHKPTLHSRMIAKARDDGQLYAQAQQATPSFSLPADCMTVIAW